MGLPLIEQARIQAQVLVPLVRTLQAELGEVRANALVRKSLGALYRQYGEAWWQGQRTSKSEEKVAAAFAAFAAGDALEYEVLKQRFSNRRPISSRSMSRSVATRSFTAS
jgi:hypothetical protein